MLVNACARGPELVIGKNLNTKNQKMLNIQNTFNPGEQFSLLLCNANFKDSYIDLIIYSIGKNNIKVQSKIQTLKIDPNYNYLQIKQAYSIPFPGKFRIEFSQLGQTIAGANVYIRKIPINEIN